MKKKFLLSFTLICISIFALGSIVVSAKTTGKYGYLTYEIENGEVTITDCSQNATNALDMEIGVLTPLKGIM